MLPLIKGHLQPTPDNELNPQRLRRNVAAHHTRERIEIGDGDRAIPELRRLLDIFLRRAGAREKREVRRDVQFRVLRKG